MLGRSSPSNSTSTTGPMTWTTCPFCLASVRREPSFDSDFLGFSAVGMCVVGLCVVRRSACESVSAADDLQQLGGDGLLAHLVGGQGEITDELVGVVGGVAHGDHACRLLAGQVLQHRLVD